MPINVIQGAAIPNSATYNANQARDARTAIAAVDFNDVWRGGRTIANTALVRVDSQGNDGNGRANLQAQLNGVTGSSTIAHVLVDASVSAVSGQAQAAQALYAIRQIRGALQQSLTSGRTYYVSGTPQ